jgi:hypothetical protein
MRALMGQLHAHYVIANLIAVAVCSVVNFLLSDRLLFRRGAKGSYQAPATSRQLLPGSLSPSEVAEMSSQYPEQLIH